MISSIGAFASMPVIGATVLSYSCFRSPITSGHFEMGQAISRARWSPSSQQRALTRHCEDLLWTDPSSLLEENGYFLDVDFNSLGNDPALTWQVWLLEMEAARCAAHYVSQVDTFVLPADDNSPDIFAPIETKGSIQCHCCCCLWVGLIGHTDWSSSQILEEVAPYGPGCCSALMEKKGFCLLLFSYKIVNNLLGAYWIYILKLLCPPQHLVQHQDKTQAAYRFDLRGVTYDGMCSTNNGVWLFKTWDTVLVVK